MPRTAGASMRTSLTALLVLIVAGAIAPAVAAPTVTLLPMVRLGDRLGTSATAGDGFFGIGAINEERQFYFSSRNQKGRRLLVQYAGGRASILAEEGQKGSLGLWPLNLWFYEPLSANDRGDLVFAGRMMADGNTATGATYLWDPERQTMTPVAKPGMPSVAGQSFEWAGGATPVINNLGEIAFVGNVKTRTGNSYPGVFLRSATGSTLPVAVPEQEMGGTRLSLAYQPSLSDDGRIAFLARRAGELIDRPFLREANAIRELALPPAPPVLIGAGAAGVWLNDRNASSLLAVHLQSLSVHAQALYRVTGDQVAPIVEPFQPMPGGGRFLSLQDLGVSRANRAGEHAFLAVLDDNSTAAYLLKPDGQLTLLLRSGMDTSVGRITAVGIGSHRSWGVGLNNAGEVLFTVAAKGRPDTVVLLPTR